MSTWTDAQTLDNRPGCSASLSLLTALLRGLCFFFVFSRCQNTWWSTGSMICMIVNTLTTTGRSALSVWNKSKSSDHLSILIFVLVCVVVCFTLIQNPSSHIYLYICSMWFTIRKLLFCSFLASHLRTDWVLLPNESRNWTRVLSLCTMGQPSFVYKRGFVHKNHLSLQDARPSLN